MAENGRKGCKALPNHLETSATGEIQCDGKQARRLLDVRVNESGGARLGVQV